MFGLYRHNLCLWNVNKLSKLENWVFCGNHHGGWHDRTLEGWGTKQSSKEVKERHQVSVFRHSCAWGGGCAVSCGLCCWRAAWGKRAEGHLHHLAQVFLYRILVTWENYSSLPALFNPLLKPPVCSHTELTAVAEGVTVMRGKFLTNGLKGKNQTWWEKATQTPKKKKKNQHSANWNRTPGKLLRTSSKL